MGDQTFPSFGVLLVDDEPAWLDSLSLSLERTAGITNLVTCQDSRNVMNILAEGKIGLVLLDLTMPHFTGQELMQTIGEQFPEVKIIVLTSLNQVETAVSCMKLGAFDYFVKTDERLGMSVLHAISIIEMQQENHEISTHLLDGSLDKPEAFCRIVTANKAMRSIFQYIESTAKSSQSILITGESGAGKELIAQAIHNLSDRSGKMVSVNVAGLDDNMFADTLFGHIKGSFTGADSTRSGLIEEAALGTLFLDEIGDLSISSQIKLLRILNDGEYFPIGSDKAKRSTARIVVATNQDLPGKMMAGQFRKDLYYRLQIHKIHIPPLRSRKDDIPLLLEHFLNEAAKELGKKKPTIPKELVHLLETYNFPGNVRELRSMVFDAVTQHKSGVLSTSSFLRAMGKLENTIPMIESDSSIDRNFLSDLETLPTSEKVIDLLIDEALRRAHGNQSLAARLLGITQSALNKRLKRRESRIKSQSQQV
jgi:DNA-binding NtrC family response regulator